MKSVGLLCVPFFLFAHSYGLKTLIDHATKSNGLLKAKEMTVQSKQESIEAAKRAYWPVLDVGADYSKVTPSNIVSPGGTGTLLANLSVDLYDGGRKSALLKAKRFEYEASAFEKAAFEKSMTLDIVQHYYGIQTLKATLYALEKRAHELKAQRDRVKKFKNNGLATQEDIDKLQAAYENNAYTIANTKLSLSTNEENLKLITGVVVQNLKNNTFKNPKHVRFETFDAIKVMQAHAHAVGQNVAAIDAGYMPQVKLSDTYHKSHFDDVSAIPGFGGDSFLLDHQNKLTISLNMRLFDHGTMAKKSEAVKYQKLALLSQIAHAKREQKMQFDLAKKSLQTSLQQQISAKSALKAAQSTYVSVKKKYENGLVDNIAYLDSLTQKTLTMARYKETLYHYEIAKSIYYYYAGKDPKEYIR